VRDDDPPVGCSAHSRQAAAIERGFLGVGLASATAWVALVIVARVPKVTTLRGRIHGVPRPKIRFLLASSRP
jgi:hypothetical protein